MDDRAPVHALPENRFATPEHPIDGFGIGQHQQYDIAALEHFGGIGGDAGARIGQRGAFSRRAIPYDQRDTRLAQIERHRLAHRAQPDEAYRRMPLSRHRIVPVCDPIGASSAVIRFEAN